MYRLPAALGVVFVLQAILNHLKLQLSHCSYDLTVVELVDKQLRHTFVHQLVNTFLKLLGLHGVIILNIFEEFGRERRQSTEMQLFAFSNRITDLKDASCIRQTYDISWPCLVNRRLTLRHELCGRGETHGLSLTYVQVGLVALELAGADLAESNT